MANASVSVDVVARDRASSTFNRVGKSASGAVGPIDKLSGALKRNVALAAAGAGALAGKYALDAVRNAMADAAAQRKLAIALQNTTGARQTDIAGVEDWISKTSMAVGVSDDELRPAFQRLAQATGSVTEAQRQLGIALDVSAGTGKSLKTVSEAMMKANNGTTASLSRLGLKTKDAQGNTLSLNDALATMATTFSGQAAAAADTFEGRMARLQIAFDENQEALGAKLLPVLTDLSGWMLSDGIPALSKLGGALGDVAGFVKPLAPALLLASGAFVTAKASASLFGTVMTSKVGVSARQLVADLRLLQAQAGGAAWKGGISATAQYAGALERTKATAKGLAKTAGLVGGLALATSGLGDKMGLTNTMSLALMGTLAGPWGAALGGAVGLVMDLASGHDTATKASQDFIATLNAESGALTKASAEWVAHELAVGGYLDSASELGVSTSDMVAAILQGGDALAAFDEKLVQIGTANGPMMLSSVQALRDAVSGTADTVAVSRSEFEATEGAVDGLGNAYSKTASKADQMKASIERLNAFLDRRGSWRSYQAAVDDAADALRQNGRTLNEHTKKGRANAAALDDMIREAGDWASTLRGSNRERFATQARQDILDAARKMGASEALLRRLRGQLKALNGQRANMYVVTHYSTQGDATPRGFGSGTDTGSGSTGSGGGRSGGAQVDGRRSGKPMTGGRVGRTTTSGYDPGTAEVISLLRGILARTGDSSGYNAFVRTGGF